VSKLIHHTLKVAQIEQLTSEAVRIHFELTPEQKTSFAYEAGQFITFRIAIDGKSHQRSYSLCSSPNVDAGLAIAVKAVHNGTVSVYLCKNLKVGDTLEALAPAGRFVWKVRPQMQQMVAFAAGSGITPIYSIIKENLHREPTTNMVLFYANKSEEHCLFYDELQALQKQFPNRISVQHFFSKTGNKQFPVRRLNRVNIADAFDWFTSKEWMREFYICGPEPLMQEIKVVLKERGIAAHSMHTEKFASPSDKEKAHKEVPLIEGTLSVDLDGDVRSLPITNKDILLNRVALSGLEPPHNCMSGICGVCMARLDEGEIVMEEDYSLTEEEKANGYILTCQAKIASEKVQITYI